MRHELNRHRTCRVDRCESVLARSAISVATEGRGLDAEPSELAQRATRGERTGERGSAAPVNPDVLAHGGFQVLQSVLRLVASGSICLRVWRKTPGAFASGCVWLRLSAGLCAQECAQDLAGQGSRLVAQFPTRALSSSKKFRMTCNSVTPNRSRKLRPSPSRLPPTNEPSGKTS